MDDAGPDEDGNGTKDPTADRGRADWRVDRPTADDDLGTLWLRWTDGGSDMHLHRVCSVVPQVTTTGRFPFFRFVSETGAAPTFRPTAGLRRGSDGTDTGPSEEHGGTGPGGAPGTDEATTRSEGTAKHEAPVRFTFLDGLPREVLRHAPFVVGVATLLLVVGAEFTPAIGGLSDLVPAFDGSNAVLFAIYLAITPLLLALLSAVDVVEYREFPRALVVYGLVVLLVAGVATSLLLFFGAEEPGAVEPNVVFVSGYLLTMLVGALLLYEAVLRIEHLFVSLAGREGDIVENTDAYREFLSDLRHDLSEATVLGVHPSRIFGVLFAAQFAIIWIIGDGPQSLDYGLGLGVNVVFDAILGIAAFQFFVLVRSFNRLLNVTGEYAEVGLRYEPFHVDGHGGFRDFGRFATRINVILGLAGLYLVYRLYVVGGRSLPAGGLTTVQDPLLATVWIISYVGPIVAYLIGTAAWTYYLFWTMHRKMLRDKEDYTRQFQGDRTPDSGRTPAAGDPIAAFEESDGPEWAALKSAPTWPVDVNMMMSLLSGNLVPLLLPATEILF